MTFRYLSITTLRLIFKLGVISPAPSVKSSGSRAKSLMVSYGARFAFSAAMDQRDGAAHAWGTGADAYGKRMAARAGLALSQAAVQHGTAAMLGLDPRGDQSRCGCTSKLRRATHALTRTFYTRDRRGRAVPNVPLVAGAAGGAMIARAWYPRDEGPGRDAARFAAVSVVGQAGANVFKEFAPELKRLIPHRKPRPTSEPRQD